MIDPYLIKKAWERTPKYNKTVTNGIAVEHMMGVSEDGDSNNTISYIDRLFKINQGLFPEGFEYAGTGFCSPIEHFEKITREYNSRRKANIARYDTYMVSLNFMYRGEPLRPVHILLPYVNDGGLCHLNGALYNISPVLTDVGYSVIQGSIFIPFRRTKLTFHSLDYQLLVDGTRDVGFILWSMIHLKMKEVSPRDVNKRKLIKSSLAHYFFAQFGVYETFREWGNCDVKVGYAHEFTEELYPTADYVRFESVELKGKQPAGEICMVVPRSQDTDFVRLLVAGFFYVMDTFPIQFASPERATNKIEWQNILGRLIYGDYRYLGKVKQDVEDHLESFSKQLDEITREELRERGLNVTGSWDLLYKIMTELRHHFYQRDHTECSVYGKRFTVLRYVLEQLNYAISSFAYQFQSLKKKKEEENGWLAEDLEAQIRKFFKLNVALSSLTADHGEINIVSYPGDNKFYRITSMLIPQDRARQSKGYNKGIFGDPTRLLDASISEVCQFNNHPKNIPDGRGRASQYVKLGPDSNVERNEDLRELIDRTNKMIHG